MPYVVEPMTLADVERVMQIETVAFSAPWSARAFRYEIAENDHSAMRAARWIPTPERGGLLHTWLRRLGLSRPGTLVGYAGAWFLVDDLHVATIAVDPEWRGRGVGALLLLSLLDAGIKHGLQRATLEVRVSNYVAQGLYRKFGFEVVSRRRRYYSDNDEDAYIMATPPFDTPYMVARLKQCRDQVQALRRSGRWGPPCQDAPRPDSTAAR